MKEVFQLPVLFNGEEQLFDAQLLQYGYIHKFAVRLKGQLVLFEQDEEGQYRAMIDYDEREKAVVHEPRLLAAIVQALTKL